MYLKNHIPFFLLVFCIFLVGCSSLKLREFDYKDRAIDTRNKPIETQDKRIYSIPSAGVFADNRFDGARLNGFVKTGFESYQAKIEPENTPINPSPLVCF